MLTVMLNNACIEAIPVIASNKNITSLKITSSMACFFRTTF